MRTLVLLLAAIGTLAQAVVVGAVLYLFGDLTGGNWMSTDGPTTGHGQAAMWVLAAVLAVVLAAPVPPLVLAALRGRPFGCRARAVIVAALVVQGLLGAVLELTTLTAAFLGALAVFSLVLLSLVTGAAADSRPAATAPAA